MYDLHAIAFSLPHDQEVRYYWDGRSLNDAASDLAVSVQALCERVRTYRGEDVSVASFLSDQDGGPLALFYAGDRFARTEGADIRLLSTKAIGNAGSWENYRIVEGYSGLIDRMVAGADIMLASPVIEVDWAQNKDIEVVLESGVRIACQRLVLALPLTSLQGGIPNFNPPLPVEKSSALEHLHMGHVTKLILTTSKCRLPIFTYLHSDFPVSTWWRIDDSGMSILVGYVGGPRGLSLSEMGQQLAIEGALEQFSSIFGPGPHFEIVKTQLVDWSKKLWIRGAYSYAAVGASGARQKLAEPVDGRLFFAGEATLAGGDAGTVHGALESGSRAATEVLQSFSIV
jgi:monoamine oxidase